MHTNDPRFLNILRCSSCQKDGLSQAGSKLRCGDCGHNYPMEGSSIFLLDQELKEQYAKYQEKARLPINRFKELIKQSPWLFQFLTYAIGSVSYFGLSSRKAVGKIYPSADEFKNKIILSIGSGTQKIHPEVINVDIFPFKNVDIVSDATKLPLKDDSVDMIVTESTLEHIPDSYRAIREMARVIKPGGYIYVSIPFLMPFHPSPSDYGRLSAEGLKFNFSEFEVKKIGMRGGPVSALITFMMFFIPLPLSLISKSLYQFATYAVMIFLTPLRIFDLIFYLFPSSIEVAAIIYFLGRKKIPEETQRDRI